MVGMVVMMVMVNTVMVVIDDDGKHVNVDGKDGYCGDGQNGGGDG